jgi:hypothetical protein
VGNSVDHGWMRSARSRRSERGASLVEAAFVTTLFFLFLFGAIEGGYGLHERLSVANMALVGARSASGNGADVLADYLVLRSVKGGSGGVASTQVTTIVVYKATTPAATVPTACKTASVAGVCNRYTGADLAKASTEFGCVGPPGPVTKIDSFWCPTARKIALSGVNGPPDYIGVYVKATHRNLTGVLGTGLTFTSDTIMRIEPRTLT